MKIALVVHDFLMGTGHGKYCIELARRFSRSHEIHVLANTFQPNLDFPIQEHRVPAWRISALASVLTFPAGAERILAREKFDIIHAQGYSSRRADVITAHVCNAARYTRTPARGLLKKVFPAFVIPRERDFFRKNQNAEIITVSRVLQREAKTEYGVSSSVIYHGVETDRLHPAETANPNAWLFVGEAVKGLREAITALKEFPKAHLSVVTRSATDPYQAFAQTIGVPNRVTFLAPMSDLAPAYRSAGLFVYPSDYDAFGMVVAEAMACGLAVVIGKDIGAAEWINDGKNGFLCSPNDPVSIRDQIARATQQLEAVRKPARETALRHSWDECANETMAIYERAIASRRVSK